MAALFDPGNNVWSRIGTSQHFVILTIIVF